MASYVFYAWFDWRFLGLLLLSTAVDFVCGLALSDPKRSNRKAWLLASIAVNLGILGTFKYLDFFSDSAAALLNAVGLSVEPVLLGITLPIGLSFYTFQSMAYTVDVYRGRSEACRDPFDFALFISFFPQLVAGPIERSRRLIPQLANPRTITRKHMSEGAELLLWGFWKKLFIADNIGIIVHEVFEHPAPDNGFLVVMATYAFAWQIYCDFSGYTDIARGLARLMGIELVVNFRLPFFASNPRDVWQRWHISLGHWLRDYLYIPLGGSRRGPVRNFFNVMITMTLGGLWHGSNLTFVAWGALHGLGLWLHRVLPIKLEGRWWKPVAIIVTFNFWCFCLVFFRAHDLGQAFSFLGLILTDFLPRSEDLQLIPRLLVPISLLFGMELFQHLSGDDVTAHRRLPRAAQVLLAVVLLVTIFIFGSTYGQRFIYFQF